MIPFPSRNYANLPKSVSHAATECRIIPYIQRDVKNVHIVTCARIHTYYSVISVSSVILRGKIAMTLAMTLLSNCLDVSFPKGVPRHV